MFNLSWVQRLTLFVMCFSAGAMMIGLSFMFLPMILLKPHKFAAAFTAGNLLAIMRYDLVFCFVILAACYQVPTLHLVLLVPENKVGFVSDWSCCVPIFVRCLFRLAPHLVASCAPGCWCMDSVVLWLCSCGSFTVWPPVTASRLTLLVSTRET